MGSGKKSGPGAAAGNHAKDRHKKDRKNVDWNKPAPPGLVGRLERPQPSSKHKSWYEFMENKDKKKKLEIQFTHDRRSPPGYLFVSAGHPALTTACKELSREQDAMIFIVTAAPSHLEKELTQHVHRVGYHFRESIVEKAQENLGDAALSFIGDSDVPEPIPEKQEDIDKQADAAIRDLFPRIPNTDRMMIINHAFNKARLAKLKDNDDPPVGLARDISLSRRVQLAVLAHIRHTHTRYDKLLRETTWDNARKTVEPICLDILVKWRGDEETGRDQLDEILCEVVVISDSESDDEDEDGDDEDESSDTPSSVVLSPRRAPGLLTLGDIPPGLASSVQDPAGATSPVMAASGQKPAQAAAYRRGDSRPRAHHAGRKSKLARKDRREARRAQRGFSRYQAARDRAWNEALERNRQRAGDPERAGTHMTASGPLNGPAQPLRAAEHPAAYDHHGTRANTWHLESPKLPSQPTFGGNPWPTVRPGIVLPTDVVVEHARSSNQVLKDHLVRSIEPYSPEGAQFPVQFPSSARSQALQTHPPVPRHQTEAISYHPGPLGHGGVNTASGHRLSENQDFITLTRRYDPAPLPLAPAAFRENVTPVSPHSRSARRDYSPMDMVGNNRQPGYRSGSLVHDVRPPRRSESRPIWIEDDDAPLRSERNPILVQDDRLPPRQFATASYLDQRPLGRDMFNSQALRPAHFDDGQPRRVENRAGYLSPAQAMADDFGEIVRVTNKFPRRYEASSVPGNEERYGLWPRESAAYDAARGFDGGRQIVSQPASVPLHRVERVVARIEEPVYRQVSAPAHARMSIGPSGPVQRQERVVGIEYVPVEHMREVTGHVRQPVSYEEERVVYRAHPPSLAPEPAPYPNPLYHTPTDQPATRSDGVIVINRRA
ncbi:hypothetical protein OQA88_12140 [Cercophora sp. LCS_1]